jgi:phage-related protein
MGHKHGYQPIESTKSMWSAIMDALSGAASTVGSIWSTIVDAITRAASTVKSIWSTILDAITEAASAVSQHLKSTKPWIGKCLRAVDEKISTTFREVAKFVKDHPRACAAALIAIVLLVAALMGGAPAVFTTCGFTAGGIAKGE